MATPNVPRQGYIILAIGVFFLIVTLVLYALGIIKTNRLLIYDSVSGLLVVLGIVYVVLSKRVAQSNNAKNPSKKNLKKASALSS